MVCGQRSQLCKLWLFHFFAHTFVTDNWFECMTKPQLPFPPPLTCIVIGYGKDAFPNAGLLCQRCCLWSIMSALSVWPYACGSATCEFCIHCHRVSPVSEMTFNIWSPTWCHSIVLQVRLYLRVQLRPHDIAVNLRI